MLKYSLVMKMENEKISLNDFMHLFITVGYLQEQRFFNLDVLKGFMMASFKLDDIEDKIVNDELNQIIDEMEKNGYVSKVKHFEYLVKINETVPFMEIVTKNFKYLDKMIKFMYNYIDYDYKVDRSKCHYNEEDLIPIEKVYKKERDV